MFIFVSHHLLSFPFESTVCLKSELFCQLPQSFKQLKTGDFYFKSEQCVIRAQKVSIQIFHDDGDYIYKLQQKASLWIYLNIWASAFNPYGCLSKQIFQRSKSYLDLFKKPIEIQNLLIHSKLCIHHTFQFRFQTVLD